MAAQVYPVGDVDLELAKRVRKWEMPLSTPVPVPETKQAVRRDAAPVMETKEKQQPQTQAPQHGTDAKRPQQEHQLHRQQQAEEEQEQDDGEEEQKKEEAAATKLQSTARMHAARKEYLESKGAMKEGEMEQVKLFVRSSQGGWVTVRTRGPKTPCGTFAFFLDAGVAWR